MTDKELIKHLKDNTDLNKVRIVFSSEIGKAEQSRESDSKLTPMEIRKLEFDSIDRILAKAIEVGLVQSIFTTEQKIAPLEVPESFDKNHISMEDFRDSLRRQLAGQIKKPSAP